MELREKIQLIRKIAEPAKGLPKATLLALEVGSVVRLNKANNRLLMVEEVYNYQETNKKGERKKFTWKEYMLRDLNDFSICFLEIEDDDGLHAYLTGEKIAQGRFDVTPSKKAKKLNVEGLNHGVFYLEETCHSVFAGKNGDEHVLTLDYETDSGVMLGVEVWEDDNVEAYLYTEEKVNQIDIIAHAE